MIKLKKASLTIAFIFLWAALSHAQEMAVPVKVQFELLDKILIFDRNLKERVGDEIVIGVVYQQKHRASLLVKDEFIKIISDLPKKQIRGIPLQCTAINFTDQFALTKEILTNKIDILYIAPLRGVNLKSISAVSQPKGILTFAASPDYTKRGLTMAIGTKGEKPQIIINLSSSRAEGVRFNSKLLQLAKIIY